MTDAITPNGGAEGQDQQSGPRLHVSRGVRLRCGKARLPELEPTGPERRIVDLVRHGDVVGRADPALIVIVVNVKPTAMQLHRPPGLDGRGTAIACQERMPGILTELLHVDAQRLRKRPHDRLDDRIGVRHQIARRLAAVAQALVERM